MAERLVFDLFAIDRASQGFRAAGRSASATADDVKKLALRLDEIGTKSAEARIGLKGSKESLAQLDQLQFKLLRLGEKTSKPNVSLEGFAKTSAEISALEIQMDRLSEKAAGPGSLLSRLLGSGPGGGLAGLGSLTGALGAGAAVVPAVAALLVEVTGLVTGLAAATAGIGAFGLLAIPTFEKVKAAYTGIAAAQKKYNAAVQLEKLDPTKAHAQAAALAFKQLQAAEQGQPPMILKIIAGIHGLVAQFDRMAKALQPDILKVFNAGLKVADALLPALLPLAQAAAPAIEGLLNQMAKFFRLTTTISIPGSDRIKTVLTPFGEFVKNLTSLVGPSITAIGEGLGHVAVALGKLLTIMSKKDVVHAINIAFDALVITIDVIAASIQRLMKSWDIWSHDSAAQIHSIVRAFETARAWIEKNFVQVLVRFFTSTLPTAFDIFRESVRIAFDRIKILALDTVLHITTAFGHLPGPLGAPFRAASASIRGELGKIQKDVADAAANINADWNRLHGKNVTLTFTLAGQGPVPGKTFPRGFAAGTPGAAPGWAWVGERGPELVRMMGGETVIPSHVARGYAAGTGPVFRDAFRPSAGVFGKRLNAAFSAAETAVIAANRATMLRKLLTASGGGAGAGIGGGVRRWAGLVSQVLGMLERPVLSGDLGIVLSQMTTESGGNPFAVNLSDSNARAGHPSVGLLQVIAGTYAMNAAPLFGYPPPVAYGVSENPLANIYAGLHYAMSRYGPGWRSVLGHGHGYDRGGWLPPGVSVAVNRTGRRERVLGPGEAPVVVLQMRGAPRNEADQFLVAWLQRLISNGQLNVKTAY